MCSIFHWVRNMSVSEPVILCLGSFSCLHKNEVHAYIISVFHLCSQLECVCTGMYVTCKFCNSVTVRSETERIILVVSAVVYMREKIYYSTNLQ